MLGSSSIGCSKILSVFLSFPPPFCISSSLADYIEAPSWNSYLFTSFSDSLSLWISFLAACYKDGWTLKRFVLARFVYFLKTYGFLWSSPSRSACCWLLASYSEYLRFLEDEPFYCEPTITGIWEIVLGKTTESFPLSEGSSFFPGIKGRERLTTGKEPFKFCSALVPGIWPSRGTDTVLFCTFFL